jgi:hypothetical protein
VILQYDIKGGGDNFVDAECESEKGDDGVMGSFGGHPGHVWLFLEKNYFLVQEQGALEQYVW